MKNALKIFAGVMLALGTALLFAFGYRGRNFGLGDAKVNLGDTEDRQRRTVESAGRIDGQLDAGKAGLERVADSLDAGTRGIEDAQTIIDRDEKLLDEAGDIFKRNAK